MEKKYEYIIRKNGHAYLEHISYEQSLKRAFISLKGIDEKLLNDKDFILEVFDKSREKSAWIHIGNKLKKDFDVCLKAIRKNLVLWEFVPFELKQRRQIVFAAANHLHMQDKFETDIIRNFELIEYLLNKPDNRISTNVAKYWIKNKKYAKNIVMKCPDVYPLADEEIRQIPYLAFFAAKSNSKNMKFFPTTLFDDENFLKTLSLLQSSIVEFLPENLHTRYDLVLPNLHLNSYAFRSLSEKARNDIIIVNQFFFSNESNSYISVKEDEWLYSREKEEFNYYYHLIGKELREKIESISTQDSKFEAFQKLAYSAMLDNTLTLKDEVKAAKKIKI